MALVNNDFTHDTDAQHSERAHIMALGIVTYGEGLTFTPEEITTVSEYADAFDAALSEQVEESADVDAVFVAIQEATDALRSQYVACQNFIRGEMVFASGPDAEYLNERFDIYGEMPPTRDGLVKVARYMRTGYDSINIELPSVTLNPVLFDDLLSRITELVALTENSVVRERSEQKAATASKNFLRSGTGEKLFRRVYHRAISFWGNDDPRLLELGLVPKSSIDTPGPGSGPGEPGEPGENEYPNAPQNFVGKMLISEGVYLLTWNALDNVQKYNVYRTVINPGDPEPMDPPAEPYATEIETNSFTDTDYKDNKVQWYWVGGVLGGVVGELAKTR